MKNTLAIAGMWTAIGSLVLLFIPVLSMLTIFSGPTGLVLSIIGLTRAKRLNHGKNESIVGICISVFGFLVQIMMLFFVATMFASSFNNY